jgi:hypothetical protein
MISLQILFKIVKILVKIEKKVSGRTASRGVVTFNLNYPIHQRKGCTGRGIVETAYLTVITQTSANEGVNRELYRR